MLKHTTALASLAILFSAGSLSASESHNSMSHSSHSNHSSYEKQASNQSNLIKSLPSKGSVSLTGTVDSVDQADRTFVLRDQNGDTIDVESDMELSVREGDRVAVNGQLDSEFMGMGKEINATSVNVMNKAQNRTASSMQNGQQNNQYDVSRAANQAGNDISRAASATGSAISNAASNTGAAISGAASSAANKTASMFEGQRTGKIDALPDSGQVELKGTVASVDKAENKLVLRDSTGDTIDVHSASNISVREGDTVRVQGDVQSEMAGMGEEIVNAKVKPTKYSFNK